MSTCPRTTPAIAAWFLLGTAVAIASDGDFVLETRIAVRLQLRIGRPVFRPGRKANQVVRRGLPETLPGHAAQPLDGEPGVLCIARRGPAVG